MANEEKQEIENSYLEELQKLIDFVEVVEEK